ncbi:hypothetical protein AWB85_16555 [Mycobacteroides immunogenum]|uniref:Uncharacterized protein n=1 Tax=Mycobacteroides immunogenum TaxID=83262 RepID=A0A179V3W0_9MYCO|nr:hypothetical protein [Mycobacteroides immunogenum]OAT66347.1 hypothetical protein AWB85_16555 [Mycobacteroides immunogenum]
MRVWRQSSLDVPRIKALARVIAAVLFITSFPVAAANGATPEGWIMASLGLMLGSLLLPSSLMRLATSSSGPAVGRTHPGRYLRENETLERPQPRRDIAFAIVSAAICVIVLVALCEPLLEPAVPGVWFGAGWLAWIGVSTVCGLDDWWRGWRARGEGVVKRVVNRHGKPAGRGHVP